MRSRLFLCLAFQSIICLLSGCSGPFNDNDPVNAEAAIPPIPAVSLQGLKVINTQINKQQGTMSILYGNDKAVQSLKSATSPPGGSVLVLVTWKERPNEDWYGDNIPGKVIAVEVVRSAATVNRLTYALYKGAGYVGVKDSADSAQRISYILHQKPSVMP